MRACVAHHSNPSLKFVLGYSLIQAAQMRTDFDGLDSTDLPASLPAGLPRQEALETYFPAAPMADNNRLTAEPSPCLLLGLHALGLKTSDPSLRPISGVCSCCCSMMMSAVVASTVISLRDVICSVPSDINYERI
jgi:hypothetical protein